VTDMTPRRMIELLQALPDHQKDWPLLALPHQDDLYTRVYAPRLVYVLPACGDTRLATDSDDPYARPAIAI